MPAIHDAHDPIKAVMTALYCKYITGCEKLLLNGHCTFNKRLSHPEMNAYFFEMWKIVKDEYNERELRSKIKKLRFCLTIPFIVTVTVLFRLWRNTRQLHKNSYLKIVIIVGTQSKNKIFMKHEGFVLSVWALLYLGKGSTK